MAEYPIYNESCISGSGKHIADNSVDLIITDPPYGINGHLLDKHYNRNEGNVIDGYVEVPEGEYGEFSHKWIREAERILKPGGSIYIVSGYTNLYHVLDALRGTSLEEVNHIIWKYNFGVYTTRKYVSSHYHILYWQKPGGRRIFNTYSRYGENERTEGNGSLNYKDLEDVWIINREYKPRQKKNKNELPTELLIKMMQYSSNENDLVCDFFMGGFSTARVAIGLNRQVTGFEISEGIYTHGMETLKKVKPGELIKSLRKPGEKVFFNKGQPWSEEEIRKLLERYKEIYRKKKNKTETVKALSEEFGRGTFSINNILKKSNPEPDENNKWF